ncbi:RNA polymerase RpoE-like sigma-24 subunit [Paraburkholderia sp. BL8N3]|nr:sigma-70 family RNA polymerase sigma factor [Paraburkholderia sp. BL8N3]TCK42354.1 RNA polymerase RpoE-like sigma-24 subunit [Paraburkholderia sp. BL8N3]
MSELTSIGFNPDLGRLRDMLLRFAILQLRDRTEAEDAVQEAMLASVARIGEFRGQAQFSTWVFAILKNKIIDTFRSRARNTAARVYEDELPADAFDALFTDHGHWKKEDRPSPWGDPEATLAQNQFWTVFQVCLDNLPPATARVFMMREFLDVSVDDVCVELAITKSNCGVIRHRAKMALRLCLQNRWFDEKGE